MATVSLAGAFEVGKVTHLILIITLIIIECTIDLTLVFAVVLVVSSLNHSKSILLMRHPHHMVFRYLFINLLLCLIMVLVGCLILNISSKLIFIEFKIIATVCKLKLFYEVILEYSKFGTDVGDVFFCGVDQLLIRRLTLN